MPDSNDHGVKEEPRAFKGEVCCKTQEAWLSRLLGRSLELG